MCPPSSETISSMIPSSRTGGATSTFLSETFNSTGSYQVRLAGLPLKRFWMENIKVFSKCEKTENEFHYCHNFNILISSLCPVSLKVRMIFTKCQPCLLVPFPLGKTNEGQNGSWQHGNNLLLFQGKHLLRFVCLSFFKIWTLLLATSKLYKFKGILILNIAAVF